MIEVKISGGDQIIKNLKLVSIQTERKLGVEALKAGAKVWTQEIKNLAPERYGKLKRSIRYKTAPRREGIKVIMFAKAFYAHIIEWGGKFHKSEPFFRTGIQNKKREAINVIRGKMLSGIARELLK